MEPGPEADSAGGEAPPAAAAAAAGAAPQEDEPSVGRAGGSGDGDGGDEEDEALLARAQKLVSKILAARANPNPRHLHALASMLEAQESRYLKEFGSSSSSNGRASHIIGRLGNLIQDNDEFFDLVQSKFLSESRYSVSIRAAAIRLILSCSSSWMYPPVFEDAVLDNIKSWVVDDIAVISGDASNWKDLGRNKPTDSEMLKAYSTGLLAISLSGGGQLVEDVLTSGLSAKLMRYLRIRVLGEANTGQKDAPFPSENRHASGASARGRDERGRRLRPVLEATRSEASRMGDEGLFGDQSTERDHDRNIVVRLPEGEECWADGPESLRTDLGDSPPEVAGVYHIVEENVEQLDERWCGQDMFDGRSRSIERYGPSRSTRDEDADENVRDDLRRRMNRGMLRNRGKGKINEVTLESDMALMSPGGGSKVGRTRGVRDRSFPKCGDAKTSSDTKNMMSRGDSDAFRDDVDDRFKECTIGSRDISDLVKKATMAAEAEATVANAPPEAIRAAGDAAAELVKTSALEAWRSSNDEEAAVLAASKAASTVVDAAIATEMSRQVQVSSDASEDPQSCETVELEKDEDSEEFYILDVESLAQLRENYTVQCLEILGEYVEALGPVLHEKGVDVCLALLQRCFKSKDSPQSLVLLPEILKLICALAAHRKFAAVFVDRGGMQKLLSVERVTQTLFGLSSCLFTIGTLQGIMERVCALPLDVVNELVELALQLLECPQDQARKNAAVFFAAAFVFRAVLDSFDAQEGLQKMLKLLHGTALVRSGGNSGALNLPNAPLRNDRSPADVLTASEKQISYHTCVALRQYFRAHLLLLVDSVRPNKGSRSLARHNSSARAAYKPLDISNEAMDAIFLQIQRDRKLGPAFVRARWPAVDNFLASNGHVIMLELCQAPPAERYLHDLASYALGVLHIVTLVPYSRKMIVNATLSNDRVGMAVILDAINSAGGVDPEVIQPALNVLVNLVCPPPSISNKPPLPAQGQQSIIHALSGPAAENRERNYERTVSDRTTPLPIQSESRERNGEANPVERGSTGALGTPFSASSSQTVVPSIPSGVVGDRRISLGPGAGCAGLAAQLEQGYRQARESVRANNGIKVLLHLLHPRMITPPATLDCLRALACRVLLGLARDETIAHILTKLQVGKKLSELIRDSGSQTSGTEQGRWQTELAQVAIELIAIVTNSGRACTLAATDAAAPTLRRIERAAIAAATPITYHSRELLLLIHEHLQASGLTATAALLQKEAQLTPLPSLSPPQPLHQASVQDAPPVHLQWPSGRAFHGFLSELSKLTSREDDTSLKHDLSLTCSKKKPLHFSSSISQAKVQPSPHPSSITKVPFALKIPFIHVMGPETPISPVPRSDIDPELQYRTPILLPMKRKLMESKDSGFGSPTKRIAGTDFVFQSAVCQTPNSARRSSAPSDAFGLTMSSMPTPRGPFGRSDLLDGADDILCSTSKAGLGTPMAQHALADSQVGGNTERVTLDSLVVQYLKHQHRQCPAPITTLPPLSLLQPHVCPEPSRNLDAPANVTARVSTREFRKEYGGIHAHRRDRQFVYSRFRPWRTCRDEAALLTCVTFLGDSSRIATGSHSGELKIFASESGNVLESQSYHQSPVTLVQSAFSGDNLLVLSSGVYDVRLWDSSSISGGPFHSFDGCKAARFSHTGTMFAALSTETARREVLLYDVQTCSLNLKLSDNLSGSSGQVRGHAQSLIHFSPLDTMLLWNGVLWDRRVSGPVHRFDQFTDYGGGGFHPSGNEVIINSEVWDLRKFRLLRSVFSLDQTVITFNAGGDVIYAILRRNLEDLASAVHSRRVRHPLFPAFRTIDAINYSDIATVPVDRCVLDLATEPTDSIIAVVAMDDHEEMFSSARLYEIGRRRPTDDDSDPDDVVDSDEEDEDEDSEADMESSLGADLDGDGGSDANDLSNDEQDELDSGDELDDDADFNIDDVDFDGGQGILEIVTEGEDEDSEVLESLSSGEEADFAGNGFGF